MSASRIDMDDFEVARIMAMSDDEVLAECKALGITDTDMLDWTDKCKLIVEKLLSGKAVKH